MNKFHIIVFVFIFLVLWAHISLFNLVERGYKLLKGLSDDINDIKKHLGLQILLRTPEQKDEDTKEFIQIKLSEGKSLKDIEEILGEDTFRRYKAYAESWKKYWEKERKKS